MRWEKAMELPGRHRLILPISVTSHSQTLYFSSGFLLGVNVEMEQTYRLVVSCPDRTGIVAKVSNFLTTYNGWITEANYHADQKNHWFFMFLGGFSCYM